MRGAGAGGAKAMQPKGFKKGGILKLWGIW